LFVYNTFFNRQLLVNKPVLFMAMHTLGFILTGISLTSNNVLIR